MDKVLIGVIGQAGEISPAVAEAARAVGRGIGSRNGILVSGGRDGVMAAASQGAKETGGLTVGILPGDDLQEGNEYLDIPLPTGLGLDYRSLVIVHSCAALIMVGGRAGTLSELTLAYQNRKPVVVLTGSGAWADRVEGLIWPGSYLDDRGFAKIHYATTPQEAVDQAFRLAAKRGVADAK